MPPVTQWGESPAPGREERRVGLKYISQPGGICVAVLLSYSCSIHVVELFASMDISIGGQESMGQDV